MILARGGAPFGDWALYPYGSNHPAVDGYKPF